MKNCVIDFIDYLERQKRQSRTIKEYGKYYEKLVQFPELNQTTVDAFIDQHNNMVARAFLRKLKLFYLAYPAKAKEAGLDISVIATLLIPEGTYKRQKQIKPLSIQEIYALEGAMADERNRLMVMISFMGGARITELLSMKAQNVKDALIEWSTRDSAPGHIRVQAKGGEEMYLTIPPTIMDRLYVWFNEQMFTVQQLEKKVWKMSERRWRQVLDAAALKALGRKVNPHLLRHSIGTFLVNQGKDILVVKEHLRHKNISTTQIYTHLAREKADQAVMAALAQPTN